MRAGAKKEPFKRPCPVKTSPAAMRCYAMTCGAIHQSGRRDSNARHSAWKAEAPLRQVVSLRNLRKAVLQAQRLRQQRMRTWKRCWLPGRSCQKRCERLSGRWWRQLAHGQAPRKSERNQFPHQRHAEWGFRIKVISSRYSTNRNCSRPDRLGDLDQLQFGDPEDVSHDRLALQLQRSRCE